MFSYFFSENLYICIPLGQKEKDFFYLIVERVSIPMTVSTKNVNTYIVQIFSNSPIFQFYSGINKNAVIQRVWSKIRFIYIPLTTAKNRFFGNFHLSWQRKVWAIFKLRLYINMLFHTKAYKIYGIADKIIITGVQDEILKFWKFFF